MEHQQSENVECLPTPRQQIDDHQARQLNSESASTYAATSSPEQIRSTPQQTATSNPSSLLQLISAFHDQLNEYNKKAQDLRNRGAEHEKRADELKKKEEFERIQAADCIAKASKIESTVESIRAGNVSSLDPAAMAIFSDLDALVANAPTYAGSATNSARAVTSEDDPHLPPSALDGVQSPQSIKTNVHAAPVAASVATVHSPTARIVTWDDPRQETRVLKSAVPNTESLPIMIPAAIPAQALGEFVAQPPQCSAKVPALTKRQAPEDALVGQSPPVKQARLKEPVMITAAEVSQIGQEAVEDQMEVSHQDVPDEDASEAQKPKANDFVLIPKRNDNFESNPVMWRISQIEWDTVLEGSPFVKRRDVGSAPDGVTAAVAQCLPCVLEEDNRIGRYKHQEIGYIGLMCKHCFGQPGYGRYFPSTKSSFVSSFPQTIVSHVVVCVGTPPWLKELVKELEERHQKSDPSHRLFSGTKGLLEYIWDQLRSYTPETIPKRDNDKLEQKVLNSNVPHTSLECKFLFDQHKESEPLISVREYSLVPDALFTAFTQVKDCEATDVDCNNIGRNRPKIQKGFKGICCVHCREEDPMAFRFFPSSAESLSQIDTCNKLLNHMLQKCNNIPPQIKDAMEVMKEIEKEEPRRYGSRKIFFSRLWANLHPEERNDPDEAVESEEIDADICLDIAPLIKDSTLVEAEDKGLVSDGYLAVFSTLNPCTLTDDDKKGWYRDRTIGFPGVCCKYCGGRRSSGRYFPHPGPFFLRSSKHAIVRHLKTCQHCPDDVKRKILALHRRDELRNGWKVHEATLGSGKVFYERFGQRLYTKLGQGESKMPALAEENKIAQEVHL